MIVADRANFTQILLDQNLITVDQLHTAKEEKKRYPRLLGEILVDLKFLDSLQLQQVLSQVTGLPYINLNEITIDPQFFNLLPTEISQKYQAIVFNYCLQEQQISVAMSDPEHIIWIDHVKKELQKILGFYPQLTLYHADPQQIQATLHSFSSAPLLQSDQGIIEKVDSILMQAVQLGVSDVHFQPEEHIVCIRYRMDGLLKTVQTFHKQNWSGVSVRLKIMAGLDIAESRRPQSGRFDKRLAGHQVDFRLSTHPTIFGENIVVRLLDKDKSLLRLSDIGFTQSNIDYLKKVAELPHGMIIISGPTWSGKTTTLYALFSELDTQNRNIMTLEEPVEYQLQGIRQTEIKEGGVISFADGVRSILRQDPDVIFIGEIRDEATAKMALRSAMTGHLVVATVHSYDCFGVPARLIDLGLQPSILAGHIVCTVSQRLIRKICSACANQGCTDCYQTGYKGRCAVVEILPFNDEIDELVSQGGNRSQIKQFCQNNSYPSLWQDGQEKLNAGITTESELNRVLGYASSYSLSFA